MLKLTTDDTEGQAPEITLSLDELAREGARRMIAAALEVEVEQYIESLRHLRDGHGRALVVRNGKSHHERTVNLGAGSIKMKAPRVDDRRPGHRFTSEILPPYMRRSPRLEEALPVLYLRGLSTGDFSEALEALLGPEVAGFSATTITRLLQVWQEEYQVWRKRSLKGREYIYLWVDGVYFNIRLEEDRLACLVVVGVLPDGRKEVIALEDGYRESTESWGSVLRDLKRRGMAFGPLSGTCTRKHRSNGAGSTRSPTSWTSCPSDCSLAPRNCCTRSCTRPIGKALSRTLLFSRRNMVPAIPRPSRH
jgi:putative transposase